MPAFGLCDHCQHQRLVGNTRGSSFSLCRRAKTDDRFPRYPRMPVVECVGFERRVAERDGPGEAPEGEAPAGGSSASR